jgi:hypothetical protein
MPPGRYGASHATRWSASVASCEATRCRHQACACAVSARRTPWSSPLPSCQNTYKTQLLASDYCTLTFETRNEPSTQPIGAMSFVKMWNTTIGAEELTVISSHQTLWGDKNWKSINTFTKLKKNGDIYITIAGNLLMWVLSGNRRMGNLWCQYQDIYTVALSIGIK